MGVDDIDDLASLDVTSFFAKLLNTKDRPLGHMSLEFGRFRGNGYFTFIADTLTFEEKTEEFRIKNNSFSIETLLRLKIGPWSNDSRRLFFGIRYLDYNVPVIVRSKEVPDPRDPNFSIVKVELPETRLRHVFSFVELPLGASHVQYQNKTLALHFFGKVRVALLGLGIARSDYAGTMFTFSTNSLIENLLGGFIQEGNQILGFLDGYEFDGGLNMSLWMGEYSKVDLSLGLVWSSWQIHSTLKTVEGLKSQLTSTEAYWGPFAKLGIQF